MAAQTFLFSQRVHLSFCPFSLNTLEMCTKLCIQKSWLKLGQANFFSLRFTQFVGFPFSVLGPYACLFSSTFKNEFIYFCTLAHHQICQKLKESFFSTQYSVLPWLQNTLDVCDLYFMLVFMGMHSHRKSVWTAIQAWTSPLSGPFSLWNIWSSHSDVDEVMLEACCVSSRHFASEKETQTDVAEFLYFKSLEWEQVEFTKSPKCQPHKCGRTKRRKCKVTKVSQLMWYFNKCTFNRYKFSSFSTLSIPLMTFKIFFL